MWLVCGSDELFARPLAVMLSSALRRLAPSEEANVIIVARGLSGATTQRLERVVRGARPHTRTTWIDSQRLDLSGMAGSRNISPATYLRLFVSDVLPADVDRAVYVDADAVVLDDLSKLAAVDLGGRTIGAARDMVIADHGHPYSGLRERTDEPGRPYFNAGVLVVDVVRWRRRRVGEAVLHYAREHGDSGNHDQDALNAVLHDDWSTLDARWNVQGSLLLLHEHPPHSWRDLLAQRQRELLAAPGVVHFSGTIKPWQPSSRHPYAARWRRELRSSGWYRPHERAAWGASFTAKRTAALTTKPARERVGPV